jgi:hypothetical protein
MKSKIKENQCSIIEVENGYQIRIGAECSGTYREMYVFQSFTEMVNFLNIFFDFRNELLYSDIPNQNSIFLNTNK